jgi:hypothetical protein
VREIGQMNSFATNHFEPCPPNVTARPVFPQYRSKRPQRRCVGGRGRSDRRGRGERPQHRADPPRFAAFSTFLTLCA